MKKYLLFVFVILLMPTVANAQNNDNDQSLIYGAAKAAVGMSRHAFDDAKAAKKAADEMKNRLDEFDCIFAKYGESPASVLKFVAAVRGWQKKLPTKMQDQVKRLISEVTTAALNKETAKLREEAVALKQQLTNEIEAVKAEVKEVKDDVAAVKERVVTLEESMVNTQKDVVEIKKNGAGVNLAPELLVVGNNRVAIADLGLRLLIPAAKSGWELGLEGLVGVNHKAEFAWGAGFDATRRLAKWVSLGPSVNLDALDDPLKPGMDEFTVHAGLRTDFHVGPVDFTVGGGLGLRYDGVPSFGWNVRGGVGVRCF